MTLRDRTRDFLIRNKDNRALRFAYRAKTVATVKGAVRKRPRESLDYVLHGREASNFTYEDANMDEMAAFVAGSLGVDVATVQGYLAELDGDSEYLDGLRAKLRANPRRDDEPRFGYRRINYCAARIWKPKVVLEAGTHDGLQASALLRALQRNAEEGSPGRLHAFDITPQAGWLIDDSLREDLTLSVGDITETLPPALEEHGVDYMIEDFGFSFPHKADILRMAVRRSLGRLVAMTELDGNPALREVCEEADGGYRTFTEVPLNHFWPGHEWGLGVFRELPGPG